MAWLSLFDADPRMLETGAAYLRMVGPAYGFFGLGLCLYFASQGAGRLLWPLLAGLLRMVLAVGGGWLALRLTGSLTWVFAGPRRGAGRLRQHARWPPSPRASGFASQEEPVRRCEPRTIRVGAGFRRPARSAVADSAP